MAYTGREVQLTQSKQKAVMISHMNVIANVLQYRTFGSVGRAKQGIETQVVLGVLPFSHIYGLVVIAQSASYMGDEVVVLPKFDFKAFLGAIETFRISQLFLVQSSCAGIKRLTFDNVTRFHRWLSEWFRVKMSCAAMI